MTEELHHGPTGAGAVIADIGGDRGALVLHTPEAMAGAEIEISSLGSAVRSHVAVLERRVAGARLFAAFYPSLRAGEYTVWNRDGTSAGIVAITGGAITQAEIGLPPDGKPVVAASRPHDPAAATTLPTGAAVSIHMSRQPPPRGTA